MNTGRMVEILPAYEMSTGARTGHDEFAHSVGVIVKEEVDGSVTLEIAGRSFEDYVNVPRARVRLCGGGEWL